MKKLTIAGAVVLLAFVLIAGPAMAQPPGGQGGQGRRGGMGTPPTFEDLDANNDGKISRDEFRGPERMFDRIDADGDGALTSEEFQAVRQRFEGGGGFGMGMGSFDPEQFQQRMLEMYKGILGSSDEEWQVLEPLVKDVMDAQQKERMAAFGGMGFGMGFGGPGGPGGPGAAPGGRRGPGMMGQANEELDGLRQALENPNTPANTLQERLAALREARKQTADELKQARDALREVLTVRQEAQLVLMGLLE